MSLWISVLSLNVVPQPGDAAGLQRPGGHSGRRSEQDERQPHEFVQLCFSVRSLPDCTKCGHLRRTLQHGIRGGEFMKVF